MMLSRIHVSNEKIEHLKVIYDGDRWDSCEQISLKITFAHGLDPVSEITGLFIHWGFLVFQQKWAMVTQQPKS